MRKAFSLVELLIVIGIIAVLSSVLFPVLNPASIGGAEGITVRHMRELSMATEVYGIDFDYRCPLAAIQRPGPSGSPGPIGTGLAYPYAYNDWPQGGLPKSNWTLWSSPARMHMASCQVDNALVPYGGRYELHEVAGAQYGDIFNVFYTTAPDTFGGPGHPENSGVTFNGDLHQLPASSIADFEHCVEWWCGNGNFGWHGRTQANPYLNCGETGGPDTCMFTPGQSPNQGQYSLGTPDSTYGEEIFTTLSPYLPQSYWIYASHKAPVAFVNTSVRIEPMGTAVYPHFLSSSGNAPWSDPWSSVAAGNGQPAAGYVAGAGLYTGIECVDANTPVKGQPDLTGDYSCYFRPDRTK